jgi:hypothetical protein
VPPATKAALRAAAERQQLTESALIKRTLEMLLHSAAPSPGVLITPKRPARPVRLYARLTAGDWALLEGRATARGLAPATYASMLIRAHLRSLAPLPKEELAALKWVTAELAAIGRNLNQIARSLQQNGEGPAASLVDLRALLRACEATFSHVRSLITANVRSWGTGDVAPDA